METGRASRFPNCLKIRKAEASSFLLIACCLEIHATHSKAWGVSITIRACPCAKETLIKSLAFVLMIQVNISRHTAFPSAQDNEPAVPRADPPLALPQNPFDFLPHSLYDRRKTKEDLL